MTYANTLRTSLIPFMVSRAIPVMGVSITLAMVAHKDVGALAVFSYTLAIFSVISALSSMSLAAIGNLVSDGSADKKNENLLFRAGFTLSTGVALVALLLCFATLQGARYLPGVQSLAGADFKTLAWIYISSVPFVIFNTFLHLFHESSGRAVTSSKIKTCCTLTGCLILGICYLSASNDFFIKIAMGYFITTEFLIFILLINLSISRHFSLQLKICRDTTNRLFKIGIPVALGLGGQKIYFYLLNERLASLDSTLVTQLSVFMTLSGLLLIPYLSLSQIHSLYVSKFPQNSLPAYFNGLLSICALTLLIAFAWGLLGGPLLNALGGETLKFNRSTYMCIVLFLSSNALLSIAMSHLRALYDTLLPQLSINIIMLAVLIPTLYAVKFEQPTINSFMLLQSMATMAGAVLLNIRIYRRHDWPDTGRRQGRCP